MQRKWMARVRFLALSLLSASLFLASCTTPPAQPPASTPRSDVTATFASATAPAPAETSTQTTASPADAATVASSTIADASNAFGFNLLHELQRAAPDDNLFISPLSLSLLLQMVYNGADGATAQEIAATLQVDDLPVESLNTASKDLQDALAATPDVELLIGNSIWVQQGYALLDTFLDTVATYFNGTAATLDFSTPAATDRVNGWVAEATAGKIDKLFESLDPNVITYLINTVYFKGAWSKPFDPSLTQAQHFRLADGREMTVPMMTQDGDFAFAMADGYAALALPYGDGNTRMIVVLPDEGVALADVIETLTPQAWKNLAEQLEGESRVIVTLPRFRMEYDATLNDALMALGMEGVFSQPDFANMIDGGGALLSYVRHKAVVEVNEEGTEAAAVSVGAMELSLPPTFTVNRPFFFAIQERTTNAILFMGATYQPEPLDE